MAATAQVIDQYSDQRWRINNLYWITDKRGKLVQFKMNWAQEQLFNNLHYSNIILKARQFGFSTYINLLGLDNAFWNPHFMALVIAHTREDAEALFTRNIKNPYDRLPPGLRAINPAEQDAAGQLSFASKSRINVATSGRGGTYQLLHVSEFGKLCAKYPSKAREIVSGSLETVGEGQMTFIESTAEGNDGYFYDMSQTALTLQRSKRKLTKKQFKMHFFAWWENPEYALSDADTALIAMSPKDLQYFADLEQKIGIKLTPNQRAFYVQKKDTLGHDMFREYPSTPEEAFQASAEGTYYADKINKLYEMGKIFKELPIEPSAVVNTSWDLGIADRTAIWLHQQVGRENRMVGYIEEEGQDYQYFVQLLNERVRDKGYIFGQHFVPHDIAKRSQQTGKKDIDILRELGLQNIITVPAQALTPVLVQIVRDFLGSCAFDESACKVGLKRLKNYRKQWSETDAEWRDAPRHDINSHGADAFRILGSTYVPTERRAMPPPDEEQLASY